MKNLTKQLFDLDYDAFLFLREVGDILFIDGESYFIEYNDECFEVEVKEGEICMFRKPDLAATKKWITNYKEKQL